MMDKKQEKQAIALIEKYGFEEGVGAGIEQYRYLAMMLGVAYGLDDDSIAKYMDMKSDNIAEIDLLRICVMLDIKLPDVGGKEITLGQIKDYVHGKHADSKQVSGNEVVLVEDSNIDGKPYLKLTNYILSEKNLSPAQLNIVLRAVKEKIPEKFIMRFARPEVSAYQMEKAMEIYQLRKKMGRK